MVAESREPCIRLLQCIPTDSHTAHTGTPRSWSCRRSRAWARGRETGRASRYIALRTAPRHRPSVRRRATADRSTIFRAAKTARV